MSTTAAATTTLPPDTSASTTATLPVEDLWGLPVVVNATYLATAGGVCMSDLKNLRWGCSRNDNPTACRRLGCRWQEATTRTTTTTPKPRPTSCPSNL